MDGWFIFASFMVIGTIIYVVFDTLNHFNNGKVRH